MANSVTVGIDQLIIGRLVNFPICDQHGVLLLAAGSVITLEQKRRIQSRGVTQVVLDSADAQQAILNKSLSREGRSARPRGQEFKHRLQSLVSGSMFGIKNTGPALQGSVTQHGSSGYDAETREGLTKQRARQSQAAATIMNEISGGQTVNGDRVADLTVTQISDLLLDFDGALDVAFNEAADSSLSAHAIRLSLLGMAIGVEMGLDMQNVRLIGMTGFVQDWGMLSVPPEIRNAKRALTAAEFLEIQKHPMRTVQMLERADQFPKIVQVVAYQTHERPDGSGYPHGRDAKSIHLFARILHVADAYAALTSPRPYRPALMPYAAMELLLSQARFKEVDAEVVRSLLHVLSLFPIGSLVTLSDGSVAQVIRSNGADYTRPVVQRLQDSSGENIPADADDAVVNMADADLRVVQALDSSDAETSCATMAVSSA